MRRYIKRAKSVPYIWHHFSPFRQKVKDQIARDKAERAEKVGIIKAGAGSNYIWISLRLPIEASFLAKVAFDFWVVL